MSQQTNIAAAFLRLTSAANALSGRLGTLSGLNTADKTSLVAALNEVKASVPVLSSLINDAATATGTTWSSTKIQTHITAAITALVNGAPGAQDTQTDGGLLSFSQAQTLTPAQQLQGCANLGIGDPAHDYLPAITAGLSAGL
jgi:hypothetical protein